MHCHNPTVLMVDLQEAGIIKAHDRHLRSLAAAQADLLTTENEAHQHQAHREGRNIRDSPLQGTRFWRQAEAYYGDL